jgi:hypothetical protein
MEYIVYFQLLLNDQDSDAKGFLFLHQNGRPSTIVFDGVLYIDKTIMKK